MTAVDRAALIAAVAEAIPFDTAAELPWWSDNDYMHGVVETIAAATGDTSQNRRSDAWSEIQTTLAEKARHVRAEKIANDYAETAYASAHGIGAGDIPAMGEEGARAIAEVRRTITAAVLHAMAETEKAR
ncbi:hypothetical protein MRBLMI12_000462 [Microbacterium sp. LMI12-1-1.1]|uniref:hypothetical protein n=1 Tax=Microbacterium sp. LMI12-1-1.1 TaxID=3135225 RepID=UPI00342ABC24